MEQAVFRAREIFDMAVGIEEQGIAFYQTAREAASSQAAGVLEYLIDQEKEHVQVFSRMREGVSDDSLLPESYPGERRNYIDSFTRDQVFSDPSAALRELGNISDPFEVIRVGVDFEHRSIVFYSWIKQIVRRSETEAIDQIIAEEHLHVNRLLKLRQEIKGE